MPTPYPIVLRERVVALLDLGREPLEVSCLMNLGVATVGRWKRAWKERGSIEPLPPRGGIVEKLGVAGKEFLLGFVEQHADATLADMVEALYEHLDIEVCDSTVSGLLVEHGYTWKKKTFRLKEMTRRLCSRCRRSSSPTWRCSTRRRSSTSTSAVPMKR